MKTDGTQLFTKRDSVTVFWQPKESLHDVMEVTCASEYDAAADTIQLKQNWKCAKDFQNIRQNLVKLSAAQ